MALRAKRAAAENARRNAVKQAAEGNAPTESPASQTAQGHVRVKFSVGAYADGFKSMEAAIDGLARYAPGGLRGGAVVKAQTALMSLRTQFAELVRKEQAAQHTKTELQSALVAERRKGMRLQSRVEALERQQLRLEATVTAQYDAPREGSVASGSVDMRVASGATQGTGNSELSPAMTPSHGGDGDAGAGGGAASLHDDESGVLQLGASAGNLDAHISGGAAGDETGGKRASAGPDSATTADASRSRPPPRVRCPICTLTVPCDHYASPSKAWAATPASMRALALAYLHTEQAQTLPPSLEQSVLRNKKFQSQLASNSHVPDGSRRPGQGGNNDGGAVEPGLRSRPPSARRRVVKHKLKAARAMRKPGPTTRKTVSKRRKRRAASSTTGAPSDRRPGDPVVVDAVSASPRDDDGHTAPSTGLQEPQGRDTPGGDTQQSTPRGWDGRASPQSSSDRATTPRSSASATRSLRQRLWGTVYTLKALPPPVFKFADPDEERWRKIVGSSSRRPRAHVLAARWAQSAPVVSTTATDSPMRDDGDHDVQGADHGTHRSEYSPSRRRRPASASLRRSGTAASLSPSRRRRRRPTSAVTKLGAAAAQQSRASSKPPRQRSGRGMSATTSEAPVAFVRPQAVTPGPSDYNTARGVGDRQVEARLTSVSSFSFPKSRRTGVGV